MKSKLFITGACGILLSVGSLFASLYLGKTPMSDLLFDNIEALTQSEQPDVNNCAYDPDYECWALHPTDPDKDIVRRDSRW